MSGVHNCRPHGDDKSQTSILFYLWLLTRLIDNQLTSSFFLHKANTGESNIIY